MKKRAILIPIFFALFFCLFISTSKATDYVPLVNIPQLQTGPASTGGDQLTQYLQKLYTMGVAAAAGLAVIMVIWGGVEYITSAAGEGKSGGKERITSAILGLLLALGSYIILQTINKDLLNLSFNITPLQITPATTANGGAGGSAGGLTPPGGFGSAGTGLVTNADGTATFTTNSPALDTDGSSAAALGFTDSTHLSDTSYHNPDGTPLNALTVPYVVVPSNSSIPLGSQVTITDNTTGKSVNAIVGDHGPAYGEMSLAAAQAIGAWSYGQGNSMPNHNITFQFAGH